MKKDGGKLMPFSSVGAVSDGSIRPEQIVDDARDSQSPLHSFFEWDDAKAAAEWRLHQAREVFNNLGRMLTIPGKAAQEKLRRKFIPIYVERFDENGGSVFIKNPGLHEEADGEAVWDRGAWHAFKKEQRSIQALLRRGGGEAH
jgi:hypothetical protein